ncbi:MAG: hypothetical protein RL095_2488 [Verrucomicrobiota bacterium]|jgi:uncharacterized membrane protein YqiK
MAALILFSLFALAALTYAVLGPLPKLARMALFVLSPLLFLIGFLIGSSVTVAADEIGVVIRHFGKTMKPGAILAQDGEQGPQARILGPGWHFGYWPFLYEVERQPVFQVPAGKLGFVTARDGAPLPAGETYARKWDDTTAMLTPERFLAEGGQKGGQLTVLSPGSYRYNPRLHLIELLDVSTVAAGTVAVIKANTGKPVDPKAEGVTLVNGTPLVDEGQCGIYRQAKAPGQYFINTRAFQVTTVKTSQRVYVYQQAVSRDNRNRQPEGQNGDWSISVRSKDGFSFPVDVRVACAIESKEAPYLVALLGDPDALKKDEQEDEQLEVLEAKVVLPTVRAVFRNVAEQKTALEFVNKRSEIEKVANAMITAELKKFHLTCDGVYVGNIHLDATESGKKLLATQTDREVAVNQQVLFAEQQKAEVSRANFVKAQEEAEQQRNLAKASYAVLVQKQEALARAATAEGEANYQRITGEGRAAAYRSMVETLGKDSVAQLEMLKLVSEGKIQITPQVMVGGQNGGALDALAGTLLRQQAKQLETEKK